MQSVLIVIHLIIVVGMIGVVLLQRSEGGGLGMGSGGGFMTNRGTANVLTRATAILAGTFFVTSLGLSILAGLDRKPSSIIQAPAGQGQGGVLDALRQQGGGVPAPGGGEQPGQQVPQVPQAPRSQ